MKADKVRGRRLRGRGGGGEMFRTRRRTPMNQQERVLFQLTRRLQAVSHAKELPSLLRRGEPDASYRQRRASRELKFVRVRSRRKRIRAHKDVSHF